MPFFIDMEAPLVTPATRALPPNLEMDDPKALASANKEAASRKRSIIAMAVLGGLMGLSAI